MPCIVFHINVINSYYVYLNCHIIVQGKLADAVQASEPDHVSRTEIIKALCAKPDDPDLAIIPELASEINLVVCYLVKKQILTKQPNASDLLHAIYPAKLAADENPPQGIELQDRNINECRDISVTICEEQGDNI